MKKVLYMTIPLLLMGYLMAIVLIPRTGPQKFEAGNKITYVQNLETKNETVPPEHINQNLNCKSCHTCDYPTKGDPCLVECPRESMVADIHSSKEGPDVVVIDEMSENYGGVVFSHKMHSQMSEMSTGCTGCHHYNTSGSIMNCRKCHESTRERENVSLPDLKAAYHRQCMTCHQQWSGVNNCNSQCHTRKGPDSEAKLQQKVKEITGKTHPLRPTPPKMTWETKYDKGKIVTFYHDEHNRLFKIDCKDCHSGDNCTKCHESKNQQDFSKIISLKKSDEEHHKPCSNCHYKDACGKCHKDGEMKPFNHSVSAGWNLKWYHNSLECSKCHGTKVPFKKLDNSCTSCHKNFTTGKFDHKLAGLILDENHKDADCNNCHLKDDFSKKPDCTGCHDDKSVPAQYPGKKVK